MDSDPLDDDQVWWLGLGLWILCLAVIVAVMLITA